MAKRAEPDYVSGKRGRYEVSPWVTHPPKCVCEICPRHRAKAIEALRAEWTRDGRRFSSADMEVEIWSLPISIRARRNAPAGVRDSRPAAAGYARQLKAQEEARLVEAVAQAVRQKLASASAVPFGRICDAYREHQRAEGKRYDRDRYRIDAAESFFGRGRDAATIDRDAYNLFKAHLAQQKREASTIIRYTTVLVAMMNFALREGLIAEHRLTHLQRPKSKKKTKPITFRRRQVAILMGPAMARFEREQADAQKQWNFQQSTRGGSVAEIKHREYVRLRSRTEQDSKWLKKVPSAVPLRGLCLIAYRTLMRPENNYTLRWEQIRLEGDRDRGRYRLDEHKNSSKGIEVEGGLHPELVRYLRPIYPGPGAKGLIHPNPATGSAYRNIRKQWRRLVEIANEMLPSDEQLTGKQAEFYTWRHTGASAIAEIGGDPIMIARMMGDTSLKTVMDHYFDSSVEHMQEVLERWDAPAGLGLDEQRPDAPNWTN